VTAGADPDAHTIGQINREIPLTILVGILDGRQSLRPRIVSDKSTVALGPHNWQPENFDQNEDAEQDDSKNR
jgi:hypothetical protein